MEEFISPKILVETLRQAFGEGLSLPLVFGYSDIPIAETEKVGGCLFKVLDKARKGTPVSLSAANVTCGGGKFYSGFSEMPERIPNFVSLKEKYKKTPEMVKEYLSALNQQLAEKPYLNFVRLDQVETLEGMEGLLFYATPDMLSGLAAWAYYDNNNADAVSSPFGSGCCTMISQAVRENRINGNRVFMGLFDPSVRPYIGVNELGFVIPRSRFITMQHTLKECCLFGTFGWSKVRERMNKNE
ncbi:MAG: DUF169 domain-containing protein [Prevotella sp.]|nr:DUF169 domain-containing protein [Prevotella sp.]